MTNNKQQTAVEWLLFELSKNGLLPDGIPINIHTQAKEMEKEQMIQAWKKGDGQFDKVSDKMSLEYYKKEYGGKK